MFDNQTTYIRPYNPWRVRPDSRTSRYSLWPYRKVDVWQIIHFDDKGNIVYASDYGTRQFMRDVARCNGFRLTEHGTYEDGFSPELHAQIVVHLYYTND